MLRAFAAGLVLRVLLCALLAEGGTCGRGAGCKSGCAGVL